MNDERSDLTYSGSKKCPNVCMFFTIVDNPSLHLTWVLTYEYIKWGTYSWLAMGARVKRFG